MKAFIHTNESRDKIYILIIHKSGAVQKKFLVIRPGESFRGMSFNELLQREGQEILIED